MALSYHDNEVKMPLLHGVAGAKRVHFDVEDYIVECRGQGHIGTYIL